MQGAPGQVVWVKDGSGQAWRHRFSTASGRSFSGAAPWLAESPLLAELQIYSQGIRARLSLPGLGCLAFAAWRSALALDRRRACLIKRQKGAASSGLVCVAGARSAVSAFAGLVLVPFFPLLGPLS